MAEMAVHDKDGSDKTFLDFLPVIVREASDERNFVKKAVNWALRQIGKRNATLNAAAIKTCAEIKDSDSRSGRWIAADALFANLEAPLSRRNLLVRSRKGPTDKVIQILNLSQLTYLVVKVHQVAGCRFLLVQSKDLHALFISLEH
jgi:hypothetical protein